MSERRFDKQVATITGGADGLGKSIARRLGGEGAHVALFDRNASLLHAAQSEFKTAGISASIYEVDVGDEGSIAAAVASLLKERGRIDVMINSAGVVGPTNVKIAEYGADAFDLVCRVNLRGSFLMTKAVLPAMLKQNYGRVLLIASIAGKDGNPGMVGYSASKAGVIGIVKGVGKEYAETGVTINGLAPAVVKTALVEQCAPEQVKYMTDKIPMKRCGTLDEVAAMSAWIVSKECSFSTGFVFDLSGGRAVY
jgi:NAD(P)-dependent dehydrogenase (short-subunit alcohol dehydrogenase family)